MYVAVISSGAVSGAGICSVPCLLSHWSFEDNIEGSSDGAVEELNINRGSVEKPCEAAWIWTKPLLQTPVEGPPNAFFHLATVK